MLSQHIGTACEALVKKGDAVAAGCKVGDCESFVSAPVHAPVNGKVRQIGLQSHAVLGRSPAVVIETDPQDNAPAEPACGEFTASFDASAYSPEAILQSVRDAGIVGMGGAGFPTRVKLEPDPRQPKTAMIINGCECEPYITCDYRIMLEWPLQIVAGILLAGRACGCSRAILAIEDNKPRAIESMTAALRDCSAENIEVAPVKTKYPQGGERQLIRAVLKQQVPTGGIPPMIGLAVMNVATAAAVAAAVALGRPLTHRVVTVTGRSVPRPGNYYVPVGMPVGDLLETCGPVEADSAKVVLGGPMMGIAVADLSTPVTKTTNAVTVLAGEDTWVGGPASRQSPCIRCGRCIEACPERLNPTRIAHAVKAGLLDLAKACYLSACIECGCCGYVCPSNIELTGYIKTGKILASRKT
jgi:electron transport complex protein RnfC